MGLNTFDLGVCVKALHIIWRWPDEFANHVEMIGPFHASMKELMKYSLMPVSPALEHQMVFFSKTNKAAVLHYLLKNVTPEELPIPRTPSSSRMA